MATIPVKSAQRPKKALRKQLETQLEKVLAGLLQKAPEKKLKKQVKKAAHQLAEGLVGYSAAARHPGNTPKAAGLAVVKKAASKTAKVATPPKKARVKPTKKVAKKAGK
ncbi:MAG: hypothetical protein NVS3B15_14620 [Sediminibacterium sp.]